MMIKPTKYTNPNLSIINISAYIIKIMSIEKIVSYTDLLFFLKKKTGDHFIDELYLLSLSFLYSLGKLEYQFENDCILWLER